MDHLIESQIYRGRLDEIEASLSRLKVANDPFYEIYSYIVIALNGQFAVALGKVSKILNSTQKRGNEFEIYLRLIRAYCFLRIGMIKEVNQDLDYCQRILDNIPISEMSDLSRSLITLRILRYQGENCWYLGSPDEARNLILQSIKIAELHDINYEVAEGYYILAHLTGYIGDLNEALIYQNKSLEIREEIGNNQFIAMSLNDLGTWSVVAGNMSEGISYFLRSLNISRELQNQFPYVTALLELGNIFVYQADYKKAEELYEIGLRISTETGMEKLQSYALHLIGLIHRDKGRNDKALNYLQHAYTIRKKIVQLQGKINDQIRITNTLYQLIVTALNMDDIELANHYMDEIDKVKLDNKFVRFRKQISKALILKNSNRIKDKVKAQSILSEIIKGDYQVNANQLSFAMINLVELLILEYELVTDKEILEEIDELLLDASKIANKHGSYRLLCEILILHAQFALLKTEIDPIFELLDNALTIAENHGLENIKEKIAVERDRILLFLKKWDEFSATKMGFDGNQVTNIDYFKNYLDDVKRIINKK